MKQLIILVIFLVASLCKAQDKPKDVFDTARRGTLAEMKGLEAIDKDTINAISPMGFSPLILACYRGNTAVAEYLAKKVKDINYNSSSGTALAATAVKGDVYLSKILLENKADPNIADPTGMTPLLYAVQFENKELVELLLKHKANVKQADKEGRTPLDHAAFTNNQEIINLLKTNR
jgi:uncharacterized protein